MRKNAEPAGIVPFVYSLPIALIVAELSTAFPEDGGYVVWVREACGAVVGSHHAYWVWVIYVVDAAIYPVLVSNYIDNWIPMGDTSRGLLAMGIVCFVTAINLLGTDVMVKFNTVLAVVSLAPTLIFTVLGLPQIQPARCVQAEGDVDWTLLVSWILWLYCGFFSLGTLAGELERPRRTFLLSIAILFPAVLILNTLPLAVALGIDGTASNYSAGYFNVLAGRVAGSWLDVCFQIGATVCLVGLYNAAIITAERSLAFLVGCHFAETSEWLSTVRKEQAGAAAPFVRWLLSTSQTGVAPIYMLFNAACASILVWMPYPILVEFSMLLSVPSILLFMWSFVALRIQRPETPRPFLIPGGLCAAVAITLVPVGISLLYAGIVGAGAALGPAARSNQRSYGEPVMQVYSMLLVVGLGVAVHALFSICCGRRRRLAVAPTAPRGGCSIKPLSHSDLGGAVEDETALLNGDGVRAGSFSPDRLFLSSTQRAGADAMSRSISSERTRRAGASAAGQSSLREGIAHLVASLATPRRGTEYLQVPCSSGPRFV